ncbi:MAG: hypothetical protein LBG80_18180 [Bacteroidales bacterium]|jgi:hypothetical protein|nr:hypothetical protein [Bacteroidales bacterium]
MKNRKNILLLFFIVTLNTLYAQQTEFKYKGVIKDSITMVALDSVRIYKIYNNDTIKILSDATGQFETVISTGTKFHFRKRGYGWQTIKVSDKNMQYIYLIPNKDSWVRNEAYYRTKMIYNGEIVPREEWDDLANINRDEIASLEVFSSKEKITFIYKSKF